MKKTNKIILCLSSLVLLSSSAFCADKAAASNEDNVLEIEMPKVPEVPKPVKVKLIENGEKSTKETIQEVFPKKQEIHFSQHVAKHPFKYEKVIVNEGSGAGSVKKGEVAAYIHSPFMKLEDLKATLQKAGFTILSTIKLNKKGSVTSVVFTDKSLEKSASKTSRGFAGALRAVVDKEDNMLSISNPIYILKAFMQDDYDSKVAEAALKKIQNNFKDLKESNEVVKFSLLDRFQFMKNMPHYQDMQTVATDVNMVLLKKALASKKVVYKQHLHNGSTVIGIKLDDKTRKFIKTTGYHNSELLPYPVLIEEGKAKILDPKYYIPIMYPKLKMSQFMKIATIPDAIFENAVNTFR